MTTRESYGSARIGDGDEGAVERPDTDSPFRILLIGDFSGRASRGVVDAFGTRRAIRIDPDDVDQKLASLKAEIKVSLGEGVPAMTISPRKLDDLHPDALLKSVSTLHELRELKDRLDHPSTFSSAAEETRLLLGLDAPAKKAVDEPRSVGAASLLDAVLEGSREALPTGDGLQKLLQRVVEPHLIPKDDPRKGELVMALDGAAAGVLRTLLRHPAFQAVESAWRAADFLLRRLETDGPLELHLLDVSEAEIRKDLGRDDLAKSGLSLLLRQGDEDESGPRWAVGVGLFELQATAADGKLLARLAKVFAGARTPLVVGAAPAVAGCPSFHTAPDPDDWDVEVEEEDAEAWGAAQSLPETRSVGLVMPRLLLRVPYGKDSDPIDAFDFDELPGGEPHGAYLWGSGAVAAALLLGKAYQSEGWDFKPLAGDVDDLPLYLYKSGGERVTKPCAEANLSIRAYEALLEKGFMPLLSIKGRDVVRLSTFQSFAGGPLRGGWES